MLRFEEIQEHNLPLKLRKVCMDLCISRVRIENMKITIALAVAPTTSGVVKYKVFQLLDKNIVVKMHVHGRLDALKMILTHCRFCSFGGITYHL